MKMFYKYYGKRYRMCMKNKVKMFHILSSGQTMKAIMKVKMSSYFIVVQLAQESLF